MLETKTPEGKGSVWLRAVEEWTRWTGASVNRGIFGAAVTIAVWTVAAKLAAVGKELIVARSFGTSDAMDAFLIAFLLPLFAINVVTGSFNSALIPTLIRVRERDGKEAAQRLLSGTLARSLALLAGMTVILAVSVNAVLPFVASGFSAEKLALTRKLFFVLLPTLVVCGLSTLWSAVLNAGQKFALVAFMPAVTPVLTIALVLGVGQAWGIHTVAVGTLGGFVLEATLLGWSLRRQGFSVWPRILGRDAAMDEVMGQLAPMIAGAFLMNSSLLVDQSMAAMLGPGSVAALGYGIKVVALILSVGSLALSTAVLPYFSRMVAAGDWPGVRHTLRTYLRLILAATFVLTCALVIGAEPMVRILFERGSFTRQDTHVVAVVTACFALQIPFYVAGILGVRLLNALGKGRAIMLICATNLVVNIIGNLLLMRWLKVAGIALTTSLVYLVSAAQVYYVIGAELKKRELGANPHG